MSEASAERKSEPSENKQRSVLSHKMTEKSMESVGKISEVESVSEMEESESSLRCTDKAIMKIEENDENATE